MVKVRLAREGDVAEIVRLEREIETAPHWPEEVYRSLALRADATRCLYVASREASGDSSSPGGWDLFGFGVGRAVEEFGEVESVVVRTQERRRGVGRALLAAVMKWCVGRGARELELEVREGGMAARRLYAGAGFVEDGRRARYYSGPVEDAVLMRWTCGEDADSSRAGSVS